MSLAVLLLFRAHFARDTPDFKHQVGVTLWNAVAAVAKEILESLVDIQEKKMVMQCYFPPPNM